jgi:PadR family transcriptional regulator, regulatory protein PadR
MARDDLGRFEELILMAVFRLRGEGYGTTIRGEVEERAGRTVSVGALYTTLERLQEKGFVTSRLGDPTPQRGGRAKRFVKITGAGERALGRSLSERSALLAGVPILGTAR